MRAKPHPGAGLDWEGEREVVVAAMQVRRLAGRRPGGRHACPHRPRARPHTTLPHTVACPAQGPLLATAFHPELTPDLRWHELFVGMVAAAVAAGARPAAGPEAGPEAGSDESR